MTTRSQCRCKRWFNVPLAVSPEGVEIYCDAERAGVQSKGTTDHGPSVSRAARNRNFHTGPAGAYVTAAVPFNGGVFHVGRCRPCVAQRVLRRISRKRSISVQQSYGNIKIKQNFQSTIQCGAGQRTLAVCNPGLPLIGRTATGQTRQTQGHVYAKRTHISGTTSSTAP